AGRAQDAGPVAGRHAAFAASARAGDGCRDATRKLRADDAMNEFAASLAARAFRLGRRVLSRPRIDLPLAIGLLILALMGLTVLYSASNLDAGTVGGQAARFLIGAVVLRDRRAVAGRGQGAGRRPGREPLARHRRDPVPAVRTDEAGDADDGR